MVQDTKGAGVLSQEKAFYLIKKIGMQFYL